MYLLVFSKDERMCTLMVNFMCQLTELKDAQIAGETFLGVSMRVFPEETHMWIGELCEADGFPSVGGTSQSVSTQTEQKAEEGWTPSLCLSSITWHTVRVCTELLASSLPSWWSNVGKNRKKSLVPCPLLCLPCSFIFHREGMWPWSQP